MNNLEIKEKILDDSYGIYELRQIGRSIGVEKPTSKKYDELKLAILQILNGEVTPKATKKVGRPPKSFLMPTGVSFPEELQALLSQSGAEEDKILSSMLLESGSNCEEFDDNKIIIMSGYLRISPASNLFYFWNQDPLSKPNQMIYVDNALASKYSLREGDYVEAKVSSTNSSACFKATAIIKINKNTSNSYTSRPQKIDFNKTIMPQEKTIIFDEELMSGYRIIALFKNRFEILEKTFAEADKLLALGKKVIFIGSELPPEIEGYTASRPKLTKFISYFGENLSSTFNMLGDAINHIKTLAIDGGDVVVFVYEILGTVDVIDTYLNLPAIKKDNNDITANQLAKKLFGLGRALENNSSITIVCGLTENNYSAPLITKDLSKVASCVITVK